MNLLDEIGRDRFRFHDLIREYALERVIAEEPEQERRACIRRELTWYLHTADAVDRLLAPKRRHVPLEDADVRPLNFDDHEAALNWCEAERPNLLAAVEQAVQIGADDLAWKLPVALIMFFHLRKHRMDRLATTLTALDAARRALDRYGEAWSLICNGGAYADLRRFEEAATAYASAQAICREIGDRQGEGMSLVNAAYALLELDRGAEAIDYAERALPIWREIDDQRNEVITLQALGDASLRQREYTSALAHYHQALPIAHEIDLETEGYLLHGLGGVHQARGAAGEAVDAYARALQVRRRIGDRRGEASSLRGLGQAHRTAGDTETARERLEAALAIFEELDDPDAEAVRADLRSAGGDEFGGQA
jgi:tetratricopeptide (TPR) repeat protein